ncbi:MAG: hypothetical protein ACYSSL_03180 [Planctomycetota bacterium]|jgi:uncharacterized membrane protein
MNKNLLRSIVSIPLGWIVSYVCSAITLIGIAIFNQETFQPDVQLSVGWSLTILSISSVYGVIGGFVTAVIAQRNEIKHTIGLAIFSLLIAVYFLIISKHTMPTWYRILGLVLIATSVLLGGWLRIKQRVVLNKESESTMMIISKLRFLVAFCISLLTFVIAVLFLTAFGGIGLLMIFQSFLGKDFHGVVFLPMFIPSAFLAFILSRYIFRTIMKSGN